MKTIAIATTLFALSAGAALAQGAPGARMDANGDGKVAASEFRDARVTMMMRADVNKDGKLTKTELETGMEATRKAGGRGPAQGPRAGMMFGMADANNDGFLSRPEIEKMIERRFQRIDVNGDGSLSQSELTAMRSGAMGGQGGGGR